MILYCPKHGCYRVSQGTVVCPDCEDEEDD